MISVVIDERAIRCFSIRTARRSRSTGLMREFAAPKSSPIASLSTIVTIITGILDNSESAFSLRSTNQPSQSDITTSN